VKCAKHSEKDHLSFARMWGLMKWLWRANNAPLPT